VSQLAKCKRCKQKIGEMTNSEMTFGEAAIGERTIGQIIQFIPYRKRDLKGGSSDKPFFKILNSSGHYIR
jgi:hypothetical protein